MLNLGFDIDFKIKKTRMPITFERKNVCVHCGGVGTLMFVDKFGRATSRDINAYDHIKCRQCDKIYSIKWDTNDVGTMYPSATNYSIPTQFSNFIHKGNISDNGVDILD